MFDKKTVERISKLFSKNSIVIGSVNNKFYFCVSVGQGFLETANKLTYSFFVLITCEISVQGKAL